MYTEHFGLNEIPFSISPDPLYLYLSQRHADALAHLLYGISESGGFIQLTGEVGTGKTTLIRSLLEQLPDKTEIALILNPQLSQRQFLQAICQELEISVQPRDTAKMLIDALNAALLEAHAQNRRVVLIVDEAQVMSPELLEQVRLLTNLETAKKKLLQIILIGQPELRAVLGRPEMRQIAQRITGRYHLEPLTLDDAAVYVAHRMKVAGGRPDVFSKRAVRKLYRLSRGIPRLINVIADRALLAAYSRDQSKVGAGLVKRAAAEVFGRDRRINPWPWAALACGIVLALWLNSLTEPAGDDPLAAGSEGGGQTGDESALVLEPADASSTLLAAAATQADNDAPPSLGELLGTMTDDAAVADAELLGLWGVVPDEADAATTASTCEHAAANGLRCMPLDGASLTELRALDRPVRLTLRDTDGGERYVVLKSLGETSGTLTIDGIDRQVSIAELTLLTYGDQLLLWRPSIIVTSGAGASGTPEPLREGDRGAGVVWLRTSLESIAGIDLSTAEPDLFDAGLSAAVRDYQRDRGLTVDGVVGDRTQISIQSDIGLQGVRLDKALR
ncbi:MAG: AAA family ATPase [Gammaproteobacteria bacterium]|nr:AAA family ATPase [Gammaproteobacteria bacterium]